MEYRIVEKRFAGYSRYKIQYKKRFFWHTITECGYGGDYGMNFSSIEDAKDFIKTHKENIASSKYLGEFIHTDLN